MNPLCDMHLPTSVPMKQIEGRTTFSGRPYGAYPTEFYFNDVYQCEICGRFYHQRLGYVHTPKKDNRDTLICHCEKGVPNQMAIISVSDDDPDLVIMGCVVCGKKSAPIPAKDAIFQH